MQIGEVIRRYRKAKNMTQEEMAGYLGVSAPAVNKWENGNSLPDIMLLGPIARLLGITLETLMQFHEELTGEEIDHLLEIARDKLTCERYETVFQWAKKEIEKYPDCDRLILWLAQLLDIQRDNTETEAADSAYYDHCLSNYYVRVLNSKDEDIREEAANALFHFYFRKEMYEKAEEHLAFLSKHSPDRKRKQALIYSKTGRTEEAYRSYEELLYGGYQTMNMVFHGIYMLAMAEDNRLKARYLAEKLKGLAGLFEMGTYHEVSSMLELAVLSRDIDLTIETMEQLLAGVEDIDAFCRSPLYEHMRFKPVKEACLNQIKDDLLEGFRDEETFAYLKADKRWQQLIRLHNGEGMSGDGD